jgi:hypothetical protein
MIIRVEFDKSNTVIEKSCDPPPPPTLLQQAWDYAKHLMP